MTSRRHRLHELCIRESNGLERLFGPFGNFSSCVALRLTGNQTNERLLHDPSICDAVCVDAKEAHPAVGPQITRDARLDARLDQADDKVATDDRLALRTEQRQLRSHGFLARELVAQPCSAQLEYMIFMLKTKYIGQYSMRALARAAKFYYLLIV